MKLLVDMNPVAKLGRAAGASEALGEGAQGGEEPQSAEPPGSDAVLAGYVEYYLNTRKQLSLGKDAPAPRSAAPLSAGRILEVPQVTLTDLASVSRKPPSAS